MSKAPLIVLNGHVLNSRFNITELNRPFPSARVTTQAVPGRHGEVIVDQTIGPRTVSFRLWAFSRDHSDLVEDMTEFTSWLFESDELCLSISDENGRVRTVVPSGDLNFEEYEERGSMLVTLMQADPFCDRTEKQLIVPSGSSATMFVSYANPQIRIAAASAVRDSTSHVWGLKFDEGDYLHVELGSDSAQSIEIDCDVPYVKVAGATSMVTLDSNWPILSAGIHTVRMDQGTGAATLIWRERSL